MAADIGKTFQNGVVALEGVSFELDAGQFASIVGPSGCGKSTLLRLIAGLTEATTGTLTLHDSPVVGPRLDVGMMFQQPTLLPWKTSLENVLLPVAVNRSVTPDDGREAGRLLDLTGLAGFEHTYPAHLSGGMQQRVALARLLMIGARTLLLDEPFGALDEFTRERLNFELLRIHAEIEATTLFVTHNITEAVMLSDKVLVMTPRPGRLATILDVDLPHPRSMDLVKSPEFNALVFAVREELGEHV